MITPTRCAQLDALLASKASEHSELRRSLTMQGLRRILARENVALSIEPWPRNGFLMPLLGSWTIIIDESQAFEARCVIGAHELAHLWAHHDPYFPRHETAIYDQSPPWYDDLREAEADYLAERMIAGPELPHGANPPISDIKKSRKRRHLASNIPLSVRKPDPPPALPGWLEEVERDADAIRLRDNAKAAAREDAKRYAERHGPLLAGPTIQFSISREAWLSIRLDDAHFPHYETAGAGMFEFVTATIPAAKAIVEQLARAGHKRTAVFVRRRIRETQE